MSEGAGRFDVSGLRCLVTGAGRGIGQVIASGFAEAGAHVVAADIDGSSAESLARDITTRGGKALGIALDVTSPESVTAAVSKAEAFGEGRIDVLVNNAGINVLKPSDAITPDEWNRIIAVNLTGVFFCSQAAARVMRHQGGGRIINIASIFGLVGPVLHAATPYATTKGGVISMTRALAVEWARDGIRVTAVAPTYVRTDMTRARVDDPDHRALVLERTPLKRVLDPDDLMGALLFLASRASEYVTGHVLAVDAGWLAE
ncbi:MAG TPA: glucose 1-dehydrogenase [Candidatus Methylomirabilis sp.]|nr:glucose 1-dehydrogenase [Candidatus Methylomirabilis sp.]